MTKNIIRQKTKQATTNDERLLVAENEIELLQEQIEFWRELVESFKSELQDKEQQLQNKEQQLQATSQELNSTNEELCSVLMFESKTLAEAKELSKKILKNNKSASQSLADVLNAIYGAQVQPEELEQIDNTSTSLKIIEANEIVNNSKQLRATSQITRDEIINISRQLRANSKALKYRFNELGVQFVMKQTTFKVFCNKIADILVKSRKITNINNPGEDTVVEPSSLLEQSSISIFNQH